MSFWKSVGKIAASVGSAVVDEAKAANERNKQYKSDMESESDHRLKSIMVNDFSHSPLKASAARRELLNRGYSEDELKEYMRQNRK
ncbi:hypothetical protein ACI1G1_003398 [Vibrio cholerae]|uniref:hypothetical protein n=1 Tax=Vibrio cholerae TaxID=666 RepID=UPI001A2C9128|nr:hypothetical protein [Vibrio cholerae]MDV2405094.1 hypothetical protein [Vibrio cholerae]GIB10590.1 hypothetical protein VCSRO184_3527 [Vibrio cholerae]HAS3165983.1 hypothetical protein [Vibrio cholerae]